MVEASLLPEAWPVPEEFRDRLGDTVGRQRVMIADGHLLLVLHKPPKRNEWIRAGRFFWRNADGEWKSSDLGDGPQSIDAHLNEYFELIQQLDRRQDHAQQATEYLEVLEATAPLTRSARNMHATLQAARQHCPNVHELINFRDHAYDIERTSELLYEDTKNGLEFAIAKRAEEQAESSQQMAVLSHRWNLMAAFFFPMVTLASIFGTNLRHGLEDIAAPVPFAIVMALGLACGFVLKGFLTRK